MFPLSEKEKLLLEYHLPDTFFAFITSFIHKIHHYLIDEFQYRPFFDEYVMEREVFDRDIKKYLYESDLVYSWINLEKYMNGEPAVPPEEAYTEIGHRAAEFQWKVQELLRKHFPEKYTQKNSADKKRMRYILKPMPKAKAKERLKAEKMDKVIDAYPSRVVEHPSSKSVHSKDAEETPLLATNQMNTVSKEQQPSQSIKNIPKQNTFMSEDSLGMDQKHSQSIARYQQEYRRYVYLEKSHPLLMKKIAEKKKTVLVSIQNTPNNTELTLFIEKGITLQPLPELKKRSLNTVEEYEQEAAKYFRYTSHYATLAAELCTKIYRFSAQTKNEHTSIFFNDILQLIKDMLKRTSFYLVPTTQHKDSSYFEVRGQKSKNSHFDFGVILEEEWNGTKIQKVIKKGVIQFY